MENVKLVDNSNVIDFKKPDSVKLGFSDGATLEAPIGYSKPYEKIDVLHSFMGGDKKDFDASVGVMRQARESGDETLKLGAILNAITALDPSLGDVPNDYIIETFMGVGKTAKDAEQYLEDISKLTEQSDENALADFDKLGADEQRKRVEANSSDLKRNKTVTGIYGIQTTVTEDNPDFDYEKAKAEYRDMLEARNTFKTFAKLRNAGFDNRVIRDVIRFKTAFETRNAAADVYAENILTEDEEYVKQFMAAVNAFSPEVRRGFFDRVMTRIAEDFDDRWGNIRDYLLDSNSDGIRFYERARKMKLIDGDGNLIADRQKVEKLRNAFEEEQNIAANRAIGGRMLAKAYANIDAQKLFNEGKRQFERRKLVRELMNANRTRFEKSGAVSETLEEALVNGFVSLEYLGLTLGVSAATGNPLAGVAASSAMMYLDEASNMYEDLRYDGNVDEATAAAASALYGVVASGLEQVQVRGLGRVFVGKKAPYSNFREYVAHGIKESLKDLVKEAVVQTATELATSVDAYMTKKFAADFADATYDEEELFNEFREEYFMLIKTMPLITLGFWGAGAPYRARAHLGEVGAKIGSGVKAIFSSADVLNNNAKSLGVIKLGEEYDAQIKSKYGRTERGREFLSRFFDATDAAQRDSVLAEYYPDVERREEVKLELEAADKATKEAQTEVIKRGLEIAKKRMEDDAALQNGDTVDISVLDGKDENGEYAVLESAIDSFGMRENVVFVESAQELSDVSGVSLKTAEEQMSRKGAMGFTSMSNGKIIILKPHLRNGADALQTFVHEYGHKIMKSIRTNDLGGYNRMCDDVLDILGGEGLARMTLPESYSNEKSIQYIADSRAVAEEILMRVVERVATKKAVDAKSRGVWARVKAWFKSLFDEKTLAEIADEKLAQMALDVLQREKKFEVNAADIKPSNRWRAKTPENNGEEVSGQWRVADASELLTSTDEGFDDKLQPRNRSRQASKEQTSDIAVNLDPERLNDSVTSDLGAPIVDSRGMVLSGNRRTLAIRQAYASEKSERADAYRQFVERRAREMGIEIPDNVKNPVLVRRVDDFGKMSAEEFAARSNKSQVAGMSVAEQAIADGRRILAADLLDYFFPDANGNVLASSNTDFVNAFLEQVGGSEMYRNSDGSIRSNLSPRIKAAVLAAMLDSDNRETVERLLDNPEGFNALVGGLMQSAANLAELSGKPEYDISEELSQAVELFVEMRNKGMKLADFSAQGDFFRAAPSDEVMFLMGLFEENPKTPSGISGVLRQYAGECKKIDTTTMDMFGTENPSKIEKLEQARDHYAADIAQQDANADLRGKYQEEGPSDAEIKEFERQIKEVKAKWTNPDGTMKKGYHCAPNGKPSKLSEEQWLWVRTPNFKRWFGDWESLAEAYPENEIFDIDEAYKFARKNLQGGSFTSKDGYSATLGREGIDKMNSGLARGKTANNRLHALAFANIGKLFGNSELLETEPPRDGNTNIKRYLKFYAPLYMDGLYAVKITVKELSGNNGNRVYSIEGLDITKESEYRGQSRGSKENSIPADYSDSVNNFVKKLREVKGNVSQVVDENGEPLVVYHGTESDFYEFKHGKAIGSGDKFGYLGEAFYATNDEDVARTYGDRVIPIFLNLKNPYVVNDPAFTSPHSAGSFAKSLNVSTDKVSDLLKSQGYDGVIAKDEDMDYVEYAVYNSNQIKSATENVGTYSENPDIRWSIREDSEIEKINTQHRELYERYKNGDQAAYEEAAKLVADYAKSKGYDVKVYHGTGADGFNVAKADASEAQNGEGAQAHDMGLYLAVMRQTAEGYRDRAPMQERHTIGGKTFEELGLTREKLNHPVIGLVQVLHSRGVEEGKKIINVRIENQTKRLESAEKHLQKADDEFVKELSQQTIDNAKKEIASDRKTLNTIDKILSILEENGLSISDYEYTFNKGKVFDWRTNLAKENTLDEQLPFSKQNAEVKKKLRKLFKDNGKDLAELMRTGYVKGNPTGGEIYGEVQSVLAHGSAAEASRLLTKYGIRGITYDGRLDGRCYVSFEGGSVVKLQDPFTFDDNGELIPLSERFDETNPDMRWKDDTVLMPIDINVLVARNIDALMNAIRKSHTSVLAKKAELDKKYPDDDKDRKSKIQNDLRLYILENFSSELVPIAKLSDEDFKFYRKQFGIRDRFVYTSFGYAIEHYFNRHPDTPIENYLLLPDTIINPDKKKEVGKWIKDELGEWIYDASQAFVKEYDKWHVSTIKVDTQLTQSGKKLIAFKNFYGARKEPYGNKKTIEDYWKNATSSSDSSRRQAKISTLNNFNRQGESSTDGVENQEKNSRLRFLLRQERTENPVIWASIVLAKEIYLGRKITASKLETVLPSAKFDGTKREYAVARAREIANRYKINKEKFGEKLDVGLQRAENDLYWRRDVMDEMYASFRSDGEEYGYIKARLKEWLKNERRRDLEKIRGLKPDEIGFDVADAIENAMDAEPERPKPSEKKLDETDEEELEEIESSGSNEAELPDKLPSDERFDTRGVVAKIRMATTKTAKQKDLDEPSRRRLYRNTLVETLTDAAKKLSFGIERERILGKIAELAGKPYVAIKIKDGDRAGQIVDNYTLRAEHIAMRIFNRGVWDSKKALAEKLDAILERRGKKPSRMQRDDKRSMTGLVQQRIYNISKYVKMDAEALEDVRREAIAKLEDVDGNFVQDAEKGKIREDVEDVLAELENVLHDIEMFGGWADKSRAEMAQALEFLEKTIDTETAAQRERVEKRKERNAAVRKIISDALKMSGHNASRDGGMRVAIRKVLNGSLPFDSFLGLLGETATGETRKLFEEWRRDLVARIDRAANAKANEVFQTRKKFIKLVEESYSTDFHDALKRLLEKKGEYEKFSKMVDGMRQPMSLANVIQLYVSATQKNYERNFFEHRVRKSEEDIAEYRKIQNTIDSIQLNNVDEYAKGMLKQSRESLERARDAIVARSVSEYISELEEVLSDGDKRFIEGLRQLYKDELPSISAVAKRVIGLPIEQADALYMPVKVKRSGNLGEGVPQVPVVPKSLSQRVPHLRDLDETADPISLFTDRISENAQFKHFSELYIEMRGIFGDGDLQDLIKQRCGADVLAGLKEFIADIATGKTRGPQNELLRKTNGLTAVMLLGFNLGSGVRQVLPGVASFAPAIGGWNVFKNMMSFFTPEGFAAALEICRSDTGRRRFEIGNMQILEELLSTPDRNRFWAAYKRHALFFNRFADKLSIMFIGQGIYRSGVEEYLRKGFSEADAKKLAMADMWQIAERTQASGRTHNMSHWQRRGGEYGKALGLFSSPPQLMFSMAYAKCRRALALGVKTPEGRAAVWDALSTLFYVAVCVEGSYALSGVLWNALLKGFFDDDDGEQILKQMALGPFGGLFVFGRIIEGAGSDYGTSLAPIEQLSRPIRHTKNLLFDAGQFDADKAMEDLDKLAKSLFPLYRDASKLYENLTD